MVLATTLVAVLVNTTEALGMTPPDWSRTVPLTAPIVVCDQPRGVTRSAAIKGNSSMPKRRVGRDEDVAMRVPPFVTECRTVPETVRAWRYGLWVFVESCG